MDLPFVLCIADVVVRFFEPDALAVVERAGRAYVAQILHRCEGICQEVVKAAERVRCAAKAIRVKANLTEFTAKFEIMITLDPCQTVDVAERVGRVRLPTAILSAICSDQATRTRDA